MKRENQPRVFFNASVILAGCASPRGGSAKLLAWVKQRKLIGIISEIVYDEAIRNASKLHLGVPMVERVLRSFHLVPAPSKVAVIRFEGIVVDVGDAHLLASCAELKTKFLVTLDRKHLLVLEGKIRDLSIISPRGLIEKFS